MTLMKCYECGHDVSSKANACPNCGAPVKPDDSKKTIGTLPEPNVSKKSIGTLPKPNVSKKSISTKLGCLILIVFVIICGVWSTYLDSSKKNAPKETQTKSSKAAKGGDKFNHVTQKQVRAAQGVIQAYGYKCDEVNEMLPFMLSKGFTVYCNDFSYEYELKDVGGNWEVTVK